MSHSQLFWHTSKSCVVNFAFFAWKVGFNQKHENAKGRESKVTGAKTVFKEWPISNTSGHFWPISLGRLKGFHAKNAKFTTHDLEVCQNS